MVWPAIIAGAGIALQVGSSYLAHKQAKKVAKAEKAAARQQAAFHIAELTRQAGEVEDLADHDVVTRIQQADASMASFRSAFAFGGGAGSTNELRGIMSIGAAEGRDLATIRDNEAAELASIEASKEAARQGLEVNLASIMARKKATQTDALISAVSGVARTGIKYLGSRPAAPGAKAGTGVAIQKE